MAVPHPWVLVWSGCWQRPFPPHTPSTPPTEIQDKQTAGLKAVVSSTLPHPLTLPILTGGPYGQASFSTMSSSNILKNLLPGNKIFIMGAAVMAQLTNPLFEVLASHKGFEFQLFHFLFFFF